MLDLGSFNKMYGVTFYYAQIQYNIDTSPFTC